MKRRLALVVVLALLLVLVANPSLSSIPAARGNEPQEPSFLTAADGDESSESITSFSETTDDDTLMYPDGYNLGLALHDWRNAMDSPTWVVPGGGSKTETAENLTFDYTGSAWVYVYTNDPSYSTVATNFHIDFEYRVNSLTVDHFRVYLFDDDYPSGAVNGQLDLNPAAANTWYSANLTVETPANGVERIMFGMQDAASEPAQLMIRDLVVTEYLDYSGYQEDFVVIRDWTTSDTSISSDGDLATITENGAGSSGRAYASFSSTDYFEYYYEFRIESMTATTANLEFWDGAAYNTLKTFTAAGTYKGIISDTDATTMQRIGFLVGSEGGNIRPDYLRIGPATEMGWQHDGSTTAGLDADLVQLTASSDGDKVTLTATASGYGRTKLRPDTTSTQAQIDPDDYSLLEISVTECTAQWYMAVYWSDSSSDLLHSYAGDTGIFRYNIEAVSGGNVDLDYIYIAILYSGSYTTTFDYFSLCSIANHTCTMSGVGTNDYLYVDSGVLYSHIDDGYIELNHDPALTVNTATYNIFNTTSGSTAPQTAYYVGSWGSYTTETRGELSSGTLTDLKLKFTAAGDCAAIKFIEDGTAPDADIVVSPDPPDDDEQVTLSSIVFDDVEVYKVWYNAISYPTGFSDVDYAATEGQENYWSYSFSSLIAGDYCFKVIANDGANNSTVTQANRDYATARFTVREAAIRLDPINQEGAEPDATHYQVSFVCNKDGDWSVTEWTQTDGSDAAETHTGVVVEGWNNIAWEKLDTDSSVVYFNMTVTNGTLTKTVPGLYLVAQTTFYVDATQIDGLDTVTVTGRISKLGNYLLYDENNELKDSGSVTDLDFTIRFNKWSGYDEQDHDFAIKFTNGTQTCWYNSSYYAFKKPVAAGVVTTDKNALYAFQASFWTGVMIFFVGLMVAIDLYRRYLKN